MSAGAAGGYGAGMSAPRVGRPDFVDFHLDMMCPYAYQTSVWIREVRARTGLTVNRRFFSLEEINRGTVADFAAPATAEGSST